MASGTADAELQEELQMAFDHIAKGSGRVDSRGLAQVLRYLGRIHTPGEVQDMLSKHGSGGGMESGAFVRMMSNAAEAAENKAAILEAFGVFDKDGSGVLSAAEIRHVLGNLGDRLSEEEVQGMVAECLDGQPTLNYNSFINRMLAH